MRFEISYMYNVVIIIHSRSCSISFVLTDI